MNRIYGMAFRGIIICPTGYPQADEQKIFLVGQIVFPIQKEIGPPSPPSPIKHGIVYMRVFVWGYRISLNLWSFEITKDFSDLVGIGEYWEGVGIVGYVTISLVVLHFLGYMYLGTTPHMCCGYCDVFSPGRTDMCAKWTSSVNTITKTDQSGNTYVLSATTFFFMF